MDKKQKKVLFEMIYEEVSAVVDQMLLEQEEPKDEEPPPDEEDGSEGGDAPIEAEEPPAPKVELGMSPSIGGTASVPVSPTAETPTAQTEQQAPAQPAAPLEPPENILQKTATNFFNELPASKNQPDPVQYLLNVAKQQIQDNYENIDDALPLVTLLAQDKNQDVKDVAKRLATFILCV